MSIDKDLNDLFENNKKWANDITAEDPDFFKRLSHIQTPRYLWIGCADSRVPANQITGLLPGELFVHRNVANMVVHTDLNCLSVLQFAVESLGVKDVIVCGHYGCGGVDAAFRYKKLGLIDNWLRHIQDVLRKYRPEIDDISGDAEKVKRLCELNVLEQAQNVCETTIVQDAWERGQTLKVHAVIYDIHDGLLKHLWSKDQ